MTTPKRKNQQKPGSASKRKPAPTRKMKPATAGGRTDVAAAVLAAIALGEDSTRQFKRDVTNGDALAAEMVAFANAEGGTIFLGVADDGTTPGLSAHDVTRLNQLIGNTANHAVRSPLTVQTKNVALPNGGVVIVLSVPKGLDKPYFDKNGVIWLKAGADKRRVNSKEELRRLFQMTDQFHADELPTRAGVDALDELRFRDFLRDTYDQQLPSRPVERMRLSREHEPCDQGWRAQPRRATVVRRATRTHQAPVRHQGGEVPGQRHSHVEV
jgi:predicted HTH transcriptional regulator